MKLLTSALNTFFLFHLLPSSIAGDLHEHRGEDGEQVHIFKYPHLLHHRHSSSNKTKEPSFIEHKFTSNLVDTSEGFCGATSAKSISGYMDIVGSKYDESDEKYYFFWFFESQNVKSQVKDGEVPPLIIWLTGGPGCSSSLALLTENGPCKVNEHGDGTIPNPYSWNMNAHMLWLDQPAGVGFSYGEENDKNEEMVGEDAYYFIQAFLKSHPAYQSSELFIVGESYGGHYAPAIAHRVMVGNEQKLEGTIDVKLSGVAVGNGLTDPAVQYQYYADMAFNNSHGIHCVDEATYKKMKDNTPTCVGMIQSCNDAPLSSFRTQFKCQVADTYCNTEVTGKYYNTGLNPYDIRKQCGDNPLCYDFSNVEKFLNLESTKEKLHVSMKSNKWVTCNNDVNGKFRADFVRDYAQDVADLLNNDIRVLIYAGDVDFICNYLGNRAWTLALEWNGEEDFNKATSEDWYDGSGSIIRSSNGMFTFLQVYDAGHMVPTDQPKAALQLINEFIYDEM